MKIYNSLTRKKEEFKPQKGKGIKIYVCGPTVYDEPHIGHGRGAYVFDVVVRYLRYKGYKVTYVRNVTDIDDKIIQRANELGEGTDKVAKKYLSRYNEDMEKLGIAAADFEPKATDHIKDMLKIIKRLIARGYAYVVGGDVYFSVRKFTDYGKLSHQTLQMLEAGSRVVSGEGKRDPLDFALWKAAKEKEPSWPSPWGAGRPGWHIECSAMSMKYLGPEFDIHGGGLDLIFPHHENEIAQSRGAGYDFAKLWMHNGLLTIEGQKMSKSLGNFISIKDLLQKYHPEVLKIFFLGAHYRSPIDFSLAKMEEAKKARERFYILFQKVGNLKKSKKVAKYHPEVEKFKARFLGAMDDDFNTALALGELFELVNLGNKNSELAPDAAAVLKELGLIFGLFQMKEEEDMGASLEKLMESIIEWRNELRKKNEFELTDKIRKDLLKLDIVLEDKAEGTTWRKR